MTRIISCLFAVYLLLIGCAGPRGPYVKTDLEGPWCSAGERAEVVMREYHNPYKSNFMQPYLRYSAIWRPVSITQFKNDFSIEHLTRTSFWQQWPDSGNGAYLTWLDRYIPSKNAPYRFYLVSVSPTVIVGISKEAVRFEEPDGRCTDYPLCMIFYGLDFPEWVWIMTRLPAAPDARLVYFAPDLSMALEEIRLDTGSATVDLGDGSQLTVSREGPDINIVRENKSPTN